LYFRWFIFFDFEGLKMSKQLSYLKCALLSKITAGEKRQYYKQKKKTLKHQLSFKKYGALGMALQKLEDYQAYQKYYLIFKQHYNINIPADVCGEGNHFALIRIKVGDIKRRWGDKVYSLTECSPYKYLETRDEKIYQKYIQKHINLGLANVNTAWDIQSFLKLEKSIQKNGYDPTKSVIVVNQDNIILDGQHRSCLLLYQYGKDYEIPVIQVSRK